MIITAMRLTKAVHSYMDKLQKVANNLALETSASHAKIENDFLAAVRNYDEDRVNMMIIDAIKRYTGKDNYREGLEGYCRKFGIASDFSEKSLRDVILFVASNKETIEKKLNASGC